MSGAAFMNRDWTLNPLDETPASAPVAPIFGAGAAPVDNAYVPSFASRWVSALQNSIQSIFQNVQNELQGVDDRLNPLEGNVAGYQVAADVDGAITGALASYDDALGVDAKIATATTDMATNASVNTAVANSKAEILGGVGPAFDTLAELKADYEGADSALTTLINARASQSDLDAANARIVALEQLVDDLYNTVYGA